MVNGNVLARGKRDKLGHWGSEGMAGPQPAPLRCIPVMGGAAGRARGAPRVPAIPGEPQHRASSPAGFPARLLPRSHGLGMAGAKLRQVCTQIWGEEAGCKGPIGSVLMPSMALHQAAVALGHPRGVLG